MRLFLKPNDTFFFRDGRPFTRGEQSEGYSIDTPFPSTVMGSLRTAYIAFCGDMAQFANGQMESIIGTKQSLVDASIQIKGIFLGRDDGPLYYPTPHDLVSKKGAESATLYPLSMESPSEAFSSNANSKLSQLLTWKDPTTQVEHAGGYISCSNLRKYLLGKSSGLISEKSSFIVDEPKVGITRNHKTLTTDEGMLYRVNMKRFNDVKFGFVVDVSGVDLLPKSALIKLGGEGKSFTYKITSQKTNPISTDDRSAIRDIVRDSGKFKLYFATHAIFNEGWLPDCFRGDIELITAAIGNYLTIGGWDVAHRRPKKAYRAIPAGSVYYFRLVNNEKIDSILDCLHYKNIGDQRTQEGFGLAYVGAVSK